MTLKDQSPIEELAELRAVELVRDLRIVLQSAAKTPGLPWECLIIPKFAPYPDGQLYFVRNDGTQTKLLHLREESAPYEDARMLKIIVFQLRAKIQMRLAEVALSLGATTETHSLLIAEELTLSANWLGDSSNQLILTMTCGFEPKPVVPPLGTREGDCTPPCGKCGHCGGCHKSEECDR